jgi:hypothetical protein
MAPQPVNLRLEAIDRGGEEYRIYDGHVEVRQLQPSVDDDGSWRRLAPEELTLHVTRGSVVAQWLKQRLGWRRLLRACTPEQDLRLFEESSSPWEHRAA